MLFLAATLNSYEITLKGGSEIKEGAEIIKEATLIASTILTINSIKFLMLILLGFALALQGIRFFASGITRVIANPSPKKGILFTILGTIFFVSGLGLIFKEELITQINKKFNCQSVTCDTPRTKTSGNIVKHFC